MGRRKVLGSLPIKPCYFDEFKDFLENKCNEHYYSRNKKLTSKELLDECRMSAIEICVRLKFEFGGILPDDWLLHVTSEFYKVCIYLFPELQKKTTSSDFMQYVKRAMSCPKLYLSSYYEKHRI